MDWNVVILLSSCFCFSLALTETNKLHKYIFSLTDNKITRFNKEVNFKVNVQSTSDD